MSHIIYIFGLGERGFRCPDPDNAGQFQIIKAVNDRNSSSRQYKVDVEDPLTARILSRERDNFVFSFHHAHGVGLTGLTRKGFRVTPASWDNDGLLTTVGIGGRISLPRSESDGNEVVYVEPWNRNVRRELKRAKGMFIHPFQEDARQAQIVGLGDHDNGGDINDALSQQKGFDVRVMSSENTALVTVNSEAVTPGDGVSISESGEEEGWTYTFVAALTEAKATATIAASDAPGEGDIVTVGTRAYRYTATPTDPDDVLIGTEDGSLVNLAKAINASTGRGTLWISNGGKNPLFAANETISSHTLTLTARAVGTAANLQVSVSSTGPVQTTADSSGGVDSVYGEVVVGVDDVHSWQNLAFAINGAPGAGTLYAVATVKNPEISAVAHADKVQLINIGDNDPWQTNLTTSQNLVVTGGFGNAFDHTLTDPVVTISKGVVATVDLIDPGVYTQLRRHFNKWVETNHS